jgi:hypothetical protein
MPCLIKNIPPQSYRASGNMGVGFPTTDYCGALPPVEEEVCPFLAKQAGNRYSIQQEDTTLLFLEECPD